MYFKDVESNASPDSISYSVLPSGIAYVCIRKNIRSEIRTDENENRSTVYVYDEVQFKTTKNKAVIESNKDDLFRMYSGEKPSIEERLEALEKAVAEIGGLL